MEFSWFELFWILLTAVCFALGFALAMRSQRKRIQQRYTEAVSKELQKRLAEEVVRQITQGPDADNKQSGAGKNDGSNTG